MAIKVLSNMETSRITVPAPGYDGDALNFGYYSESVSSLASATLAAAYDSTQDFYSVGDVVTKDSLLYRCSDTTSGSFDLTKWDTITIINNGKINGNLLPTSVASSSPVAATSDDVNKIPLLDSSGELSLKHLPVSVADNDSSSNTSTDQKRIPLLDSTGKLSWKHLRNSFGTLTVTGTFTANGVIISNATVQTTLVVPTPTANNHAATKKYVDDVDAKLLGAGSLLKYKRKFTFPLSSTYNSSGSAYTLDSIGDDYIGWHLSCTGVANTNTDYTYYMKLPEVTFAETSSDSFGRTYEIVIIARKKSSDTTGKVTFHIIDSGNTEVDWLGDAPEDLERGFAYFLVLRSFAYGTSSVSYAHKWVGNIQGKIPIPNES